MALDSPLVPITIDIYSRNLYPASGESTSPLDKDLSDWLQQDLISGYMMKPLDDFCPSSSTKFLNENGDKASPAAERSDQLDWEGHKDIIVDLYIHQNLSMKDLINYMTKYYNFAATKRMYHTRFSAWQVQKNEKSDQKDALALKLIEAYLSGKELPPLTQAERRKLGRHAKDPASKLSKTDRTKLLKVLADSAAKSKSPMSDSTTVGNPSQASHTPVSQLTPQSASTPSPSPPMSSDDTTPSLPIVLLNTRWYYQAQYQKAVFPDPMPCKKFWADIKSAIYFLKVGSNQLAWPILFDAGAKVDALCEEQPINLMQNICATISPTNTKVCPEFRIQLLRLFAATANQKWGSQHPLTVVCHELQKDATAELSITVLHLMVDDFESNLGRLNAVVIHLKRTLITLLRRNNDLLTARKVSLELIKSTTEDFGPDSKWTRLAMTELVHILTDERRWKEAAKVCQAELESARRDVDTAFPDPPTIYAMEDMAEICGQLGQWSQAQGWLEAAVEGALSVWGPVHSTQHIRDKLERVRSLKSTDKPSDLFWK